MVSEPRAERSFLDPTTLASTRQAAPRATVGEAQWEKRRRRAGYSSACRGILAMFVGKSQVPRSIFGSAERQNAGPRETEGIKRRLIFALRE
jgi:hypothetical protein